MKKNDKIYERMKKNDKIYEIYAKKWKKKILMKFLSRQKDFEKWDEQTN